MLSEKDIYDKFIELYRKELDNHWQVNAPIWLKRDLWSLHVNHGWGKVRLERYLKNKIEEFKCLNSGHINDEDIEQGLKDLGIELKL